MIRFGMKLPEIFNQLVRGYQKVRGQKPEGLDLIKIKQEAMQKFQDMRKVLDMQGKALDTSKPIIGGTQQGNAIKSGIMKATGAGPEVVEGINPKFIDFTINSFKNMDGIKVMKEGNKVIKREGPYKDLTKNDAKRILDAVDDKMKNIDMDPEDMYADGGRIGLKDGMNMKMASMDDDYEKEFMKRVRDLREQGFSQEEAIEAARDELERLRSKFMATGGRAGFKNGEGIMQMASAPDPMDERNSMMENIAMQEFGKPLSDLSEEEIIEIELFMDEMSKRKDKPRNMNMASNDMNERLLEKIFDDLLEQGTDPKDAEIKAREIFNEMGDTSSMPDRGAPSIKLADGGITRIGLKKGSGFFRSLLPFSGDNKYSKQLEGIIYGSEGISEGLSLLSNIGLFADGGRIGYKDGPKDPRRRGFMKAAVGVASMLPFGIGKGIKMAKPAIERGAEIAAPALAKLVETVMSLGKTISQSGKRVKEMVTKKKLGKVEVEEDIQDASYIIKKDGKEIYFKPGRQDEMGIDDDIIEVIEKTVTKKADGGRAQYSKGDIVDPNDLGIMSLDTEEVENTYAPIDGQTAGLGVSSFLIDKFGPKIGAAIFNAGKKRILKEGKKRIIDKPIQKILTTSGGSAANASIYNGGYSGGKDSSGNAVSFDSAPGTTTFDSKSGRGRRDYQQGGVARLLGE